MSSINSKPLFKALIAVVGLLGASAVMASPTIAQTDGVDYNNPVNPANPDASGGEAFERTPSDQPLPDAPASDIPDTIDTNDGLYDDTTEDGFGGGEGGVDYENPVNPANPDAPGGEAFERTPGDQPLPDAPASDIPDTIDTNDGMMYEETTDDGFGGGEGGMDSDYEMYDLGGSVDYNNPINPANPDIQGGDAFERVPGNMPLPMDESMME